MFGIPSTLTADERRAATADLTARFFQGLSDPSRVRILELLVDGEKNVSQLVELTGLPQNRVSTHLGCLRTCGFVTGRRDGRFVRYQVTDPRVRELVRLARTIIADNAAQILACHVVGKPSSTDEEIGQ
ncbi:MAG: winged helix-turn-helix transcriptional regulator [Chloroflexi bacterium]|nr:winged helix-turn-helix transcriptional regulator [Chloroflexota bacterium]